MNTDFYIKSWDDVNKALKLKGECELSLDTLEAEMNLKINDIKLETEKLSKPLKNKIKQVGFRLVNTVSVPTKKLGKIIENLKKFGMENCIKVTESVNKDILGTYSNADIAKVGATKKVEDKFWCEADKERIRG